MSRPGEGMAECRVADGRLVCARTRMAKTFRQRLRGLLGHRELAADEGMLITPCRDVHTLGMRFTIDVVMLDSQMCIRRLHRGLRPWRLALGGKGVHCVLELPEGAIARHRLENGEKLTLHQRGAEND